MSMAESKVYSLENSELSVEVMPFEGGRISSLKSLRSGLEFLTQSRWSGGYPQTGLDARFRDGPCAGIEECLPTVGPSGPETTGGRAPDHGDFWQLPWQVLAASDTGLNMSAVGFSRTFRFSKKLSLQGNALRVAYRVENSGWRTQSYLYACHPLFAVSVGDRVVLPRETRELRLDYSREDRLGAPGTIITWPVTQSDLRLDLALGPEAGTAAMFYSSRLGEGICGIYREASGQVLELSFDHRCLPFLGIWLCYGGWPNEGNGPFQYAVALEPTTASCNTLCKAQQIGADISLDAGEIFDWEILFSVREPAQVTF